MLSVSIKNITGAPLTYYSGVHVTARTNLFGINFSNARQEFVFAWGPCARGVGVTQE